jgi:recombination protein RecA
MEFSMARQKKDSASLDNLFTDIASATGAELVSDLDQARYFIDTGNFAINYCCSGKFYGGGIPGGRLSEIYGPSASSKSLIGANILAGMQRMGGIGVILDTENAINGEFIQNATKCDISKLLRYTPETLEDCFSTMYRVINYIRKVKKIEVPVCIVYDSISVSPSAREFRETKLPEGYSKADFKRIVGGNEQPGERAKICSKELRKLNTEMEQNDVTVVVLNQIRDKIGVLYGNPETTAGGGQGLPFYASLRMRSQTQKKIEQTIPGMGKKKILGINIKVQNKKNRSYRPFVEVDNIPLYFDRGMNPLGGVLGALLDSGRVIAGGAGNYTISPQYTDGKEVKFKSSMERNDIPQEIAEEYAQILDTTSEQMKEYLQLYADVINYKVIGEVVDVDDDSDIEVDDLLGCMG